MRGEIAGSEEIRGEAATRGGEAARARQEGGETRGRKTKKAVRRGVELEAQRGMKRGECEWSSSEVSRPGRA